MNNFKVNVVFTYFLGLMLFCTPVSQAHAEHLDAIAAVVNGEAITCFDVKVAKEDLEKKLAQQGVDIPSGEVLFKRALDEKELIILQRQEAKKIDIEISSDEVEAAIQGVEERNNLQPGQLKDVLKAQGIDFETYRENIKDKLLNTRLVNLMVRSKVNVSEEAMREYYRKHLKNPKPVREVHVSQIFIALPAGAPAERVEILREKAEGLYQKLLSGEDFEMLAALESDAPNDDMGWISPGTVKGSFAQVFQLKVGEVTHPIRSAGGFHLVKVLDERMRKPANTEAYEEVHARHILLKIPDSADLNAQIKIRERAQKIVEEMKGASDEAFAVRAKELSQGPSASRGGDLGWFKPGKMVPSFEKAAFALKAGETSDVVVTDFGLHIIRVVERRKVNPNSFEAHRSGIEQLLTDTEMQQEVPRWMNGLKEQAKIEVRQCPQGFITEQADVQRISPADKEDEAKKVVGMNADRSGAQAAQENSIQSLTSWKQAWEHQNFDAYFKAYDSSTSPDKRFPSFGLWKAYKQRIIPKHHDIKVSIENLDTEVLEDNQMVRMTFDQHFMSHKTNDYDKKEMVMKKIDGEWKIIREHTVK